MLFTLSAKYAIVALSELASRSDEHPIQIRKIAEAAGIPRPFLAKLVPPLVKVGILASTRGKQGGLKFARPPSQVSIADVLRAVSGEYALYECPFRFSPCPGRTDCPLYPVWDPLRNQIIALFETTSLSKLAAMIKKHKLKEER